MNKVGAPVIMGVVKPQIGDPVGCVLGLAGLDRDSYLIER